MRKLFFVCCGHLALATGVMGIFLPILPTTPFVLLACGCYAKGSEKFSLKLRASKRFSQLISDWENHRSIPQRAKILGILMVAASVISTIVTVSMIAVKIAVGIIGVVVSLYLLSRPSRKKT